MYANTEGNNSMISFVKCTVSSNIASVGSGELYAVVCERCCDNVFCSCPYLRVVQEEECGQRLRVATP